MSGKESDFEKLTLLDRLEDLLEDMEELGITDITQLMARIEQLEAEIEDADAGEDGPV